MITLTVTLRSTSHQIVLAYDSETSMCDGAKELIEDGPGLMLSDDYGQVAKMQRNDVASICTVDVEKHWEYRNKVSIIKLKAENDFNRLLNEQPDLRFLVGGVRPEFGSK